MKVAVYGSGGIKVLHVNVKKDEQELIQSKVGGDKFFIKSQQGGSLTLVVDPTGNKSFNSRGVLTVAVAPGTKPMASTEARYETKGKFIKVSWSTKGVKKPMTKNKTSSRKKDGPTLRDMDAVRSAILRLNALAAQHGVVLSVNEKGRITATVQITTKIV